MKNILTVVWGIDEKNLYTALFIKNGKVVDEFRGTLDDKYCLIKLLEYIFLKDVKLVLIEDPKHLENIRRKIFGKKSLEKKKWRKKQEFVLLSFYSLLQAFNEYYIEYKIIESKLKHYLPAMRFL